MSLSHDSSPLILIFTLSNHAYEVTQYFTKNTCNKRLRLGPHRRSVNDSIPTGLSRVRTPIRTRLFVSVKRTQRPVQKVPGILSVVKRLGRGMITPPPLAPRFDLYLCSLPPGIMGCYRVNFNFFFYYGPHTGFALALSFSDQISVSFWQLSLSRIFYTAWLSGHCKAKWRIWTVELFVMRLSSESCYIFAIRSHIILRTVSQENRRSSEWGKFHIHARYKGTLYFCITDFGRCLN